jgi:hypothetical protein
MADGYICHPFFNDCELEFGFFLILSKKQLGSTGFDSEIELIVSM